MASSYTTSSATISEWSFITITVEFITDTTSITTTSITFRHFIQLTSNQIFTDTSPSTITIGSSYTGFVYGFKLWNSAVYSFSTEVNDEICGTAVDSHACSLAAIMSTILLLASLVLIHALQAV